MSHDRFAPKRVAVPAIASPSRAEMPGTLAAWLERPVGARAESEAPAFFTGHLRGFDDEGRLLFQPEGASEPFTVAIGIEISDAAIVRAARRDQRAIVIRSADPTPRPILIGLVRERVAERARAAKPGRLELLVDGEKITLEAKHDLELRCGQASLPLRYDGRIEVRGTHILSASRGPNRVKGATIALN